MWDAESSRSGEPSHPEEHLTDALAKANEQIEALQKGNNDLTDRVKVMEEQLAAVQKAAPVVDRIKNREKRLASRPSLSASPSSPREYYAKVREKMQQDRVAKRQEDMMKHTIEYLKKNNDKPNKILERDRYKDGKSWKEQYVESESGTGSWKKIENSKKAAEFLTKEERQKNNPLVTAPTLAPKDDTRRDELIRQQASRENSYLNGTPGYRSPTVNDSPLGSELALQQRSREAILGTSVRSGFASSPTVTHFERGRLDGGGRFGVGSTEKLTVTQTSSRIPKQKEETKKRPEALKKLDENIALAEKISYEPESTFRTSKDYPGGIETGIPNGGKLVLTVNEGKFSQIIAKDFGINQRIAEPIISRIQVQDLGVGDTPKMKVATIQNAQELLHAFAQQFASMVYREREVSKNIRTRSVDSTSSTTKTEEVTAASERQAENLVIKKENKKTEKASDKNSEDSKSNPPSDSTFKERSIRETSTSNSNKSSSSQENNSSVNITRWDPKNILSDSSKGELVVATDVTREGMSSTKFNSWHTGSPPTILHFIGQGGAASYNIPFSEIPSGKAYQTKDANVIVIRNDDGSAEVLIRSGQYNVQGRYGSSNDRVSVETPDVEKGGTQK